MSHNFKPGDQALIIGFKKSPVNLGKSCELVAFMRPGETINYPNGKFDGVVYIGTAPAWLVAGDEIISSAGCPGYTIVHPENLMPLRGDFSPEQQKECEVVR